MNRDSKKYDATVNYLYSLQKHGIKLGLSNTKKLMEILGAPHGSFNSIHIAGTNGKGSTATAISSILKESGFATGLFTSPHLVSFTERISINGQRISEDNVIDIAAEVRRAISGKDLNPTFFEFVTAMAFYYFAQNNVDWAVVETGMGGRLDATNVIQPQITLITNISLDHSEFLGNSISDITFEKAGIIKPGVPLVTSSDRPEVVNQLKGIADSIGADIHIYNRDFTGTLLKMDDNSITMDYSGYTPHNNLTVPVSGHYQLYNISMAIRTCEILREKGIPISDDSIRKGLRNFSLEGRLEKISDSPPIYLDGAHNPEAAASLADAVRKLFPDKNIFLISGIMGDKDVREILEPLLEIADSAVLTKPEYDRSASPEKLRDMARDIINSRTGTPLSYIECTSSITEALNLARSRCDEHSIILVTGSFYTTGETKEILGSGGVLSRLRE